MRRSLTLAVLTLSAAPAALAQGWEAEARLTIAASAVEEESPLAAAGDGLLGSGSLVVTRSDTFENGLTLAWRGELLVSRDAAARPGFAGVLGDCPAAAALCPRIADGAGFLSPVSPATGLAVDGGPVDEDVFATLEGASLSISGPWGEGIIGVDSGVAAQLDARAPNLLQGVSAISPALDPTGLVVTRARNDVAGRSFKASYMTPRWIGFRLGASFTPKADQRGADFDPDFGGAGLAKAELENIWEGAISFDRRFQPSRLRVRAAATYSRADSSSGFAAFGDYEAWGAGFELEQGGWTGGLRWLSSNNAWNSGDGDYEAWEAGLAHQGENWRFGIEAGWSDDRLNGLEGASWLVGATRNINERVALGLAWISAEAELPVLSGVTLNSESVRNDGVVLELTVRN
jgi:hypothetical protein